MLDYLKTNHSIVLVFGDAGKGWDGTIQGKPSSSGVYVWTCRYQLDGEAEKVEKGTVMLVR